VLRTTSATLDTYSANVAVNGSFYFYSNPSSQTDGNGTGGLINRGIVASDGDVYSPFEYDSRPWVVVNIAEDNQVDFATRNVPNRPSGGVRPINTDTTPDLSFYNALSGSEQIVINGVNTAGHSGVTYGTPTVARARTGIGTTADNKLLMITIDEGSNASRGATWYELAEVMRQYGVVDGINVDGGGSTTMAMRQDGQNAQVV
jgi:exopolysaccharide biosynthesis protein